MPTSWNGRTQPTTSWNGRTAPTTSWTTPRIGGNYLMTKAGDYILTKAGERIIVKVPGGTTNWTARPVI